MTHHGYCVWLTGLPSAGKTTIAKRLLPKLRDRGWNVELLDGDEIRLGLSADLGFGRADREKHAQRVAFLAKVLARNGVVSLVALISPYRASRARARAEIGRMVEVYVSTPIDACMERDVKGLYQKAKAGEITGMTGVDDPYEPPEKPDITVDTLATTPDQAAEFILEELERLGWPTREGDEPSAVPARAGAA